jgi:hypothetical protein
MDMLRLFGRLTGLLILLVPAAAPARAEAAAHAALPQLAAAQDPAPTPPPASPAPAAEAPPARVGRVDLVSGNLAFHMHGEKAWSAAGQNYPVAEGGSFWTDPKSRAVLRIGPSTIDLAADTELDVVTLNDQVAEFGLAKGEVRLHLRELGTGQSFSVDLAQGGVWLLQPGEYEIAAGGAGAPARVTALAGSARFVGGGADVGIKTGEVAVLTGTNPVVAKIEAASPGEFVAWCRSHEYAETRLAAPYYVSPQMTGYEALDQYGSWASVPEYGEVWYPAVGADWVPYSLGLWTWVGPWGWTWVDAEPWGFAPFHYGRWAHIGGRWGWVAGGYVTHPVYAPALVGFVGGSFGVGWFPLGPGEVYWPHYTGNLAYVRAVNAGALSNVAAAVNLGPRGFAAAHFANRGFAVAVPARVFESAEPVGPAAVHVGAAELARAHVAVAPPGVLAPAIAHAAALAAPNRAALPPAAAASARAPVHAFRPAHRPVAASHLRVPAARSPAAALHRGQVVRAPSVFHGASHAASLPRFGGGFPHPFFGMPVAAPHMTGSAPHMMGGAPHGPGPAPGGHPGDHH